MLLSFLAFWLVAELFLLPVKTGDFAFFLWSYLCSLSIYIYLLPPLSSAVVVDVLSFSFVGGVEAPA